MTTKQTCSTCNGSGHDKGGLPLVKFEMVRQPDGTDKRCHVTYKQGSGCISCLGVGYKETDNG
jgi:hypothetical protein